VVDKKNGKETKRQGEEEKNKKVESERELEEEKLKQDQLKRKKEKTQKRLKKESQKQEEIYTRENIKETKESPDGKLDTQAEIEYEDIDGDEEKKVETLGPEVREIENNAAEQFLKELLDLDTPIKRKEDMLMMYLFTIP